MTNTTPSPVARGKIFSIAPMMDENENIDKTMD
jgi:hypothetical protein